MITYGTIKWFSENVENLTKTLTPITFFAISEETEIHYGLQDDVDFEWCDEHNIKYYNIKRIGGAIVSPKGNINIADIHPHKGIWRFYKFLEDFNEWLISKGIDSIIDRNDIMVDNKKVASAVGINLEPNFTWQYTGIQISITQDMEVIKNACKKEMNKIPGGLEEYGITTEEAVQWCENWFKAIEK